MVLDRAAYHPVSTVLTALEIENAVVANSLTDRRDIETVLLIKNNHVACAVMQSQSYLRIVAFLLLMVITSLWDVIIYLKISLGVSKQNVDLFQTDLEEG